MEEIPSYQSNTSQTGTIFSSINVKELKWKIKEKKSRFPHEYKVGNILLICRNKKCKHGEREKNGPYPIVQVNNNGTVRYDKGTYSDIINIRQCEPYQV